MDFIWINRDQRSFEWFFQLLAQLEVEQVQSFLFFSVPHLAAFIFKFFFNVIAKILAYIHPVYGAGVWTHDLLIMSRLLYPPDHDFLPDKVF